MSKFSLKRSVLSTLATAVILFFHKMDAVQYVVSTITGNDNVDLNKTG